MKSLKNLTGDSLEQLIDYNVVDQNGDEIGTLHSLWSDPDTGSVEFLGVKTGWLFGHNHVVPAGKAELDESANVVRLPYTEAFIKEAPSISADAEISEEEETNIYDYYGMGRDGAATTAASYPAATDTGTDTSATDNYIGGGVGTVPEAIGTANLADTSSTDEGVSRYAAPDKGDNVTSAGSASRWRRTIRPGDLQTGAGTASVGGATQSTEPSTDSFNSPTSAGEAVRSALDTLSPSDSSGSRTPMTPASPGSYGTANLYGSTGASTPVAADSLGSASGFEAPSTSGTGYAGGTSTTNPDDTTPASGGFGARETSDTNLDPITGEPGAHPVGTGVGALSGGAAGAAIGGAIGGPIGAPVGAVIGGIVGAVGGGLAGKGVAESINPTEEDAYWESNHQVSSYYDKDYEYSDYAPAYKAGYEGYGKYSESGRDFESAEPDLKSDYEQAKGGSRLEWEKAKSATRDAWERLKAKASDTAK